MELDELIGQLALIPGARVGRGPRHPEKPDPSLAERVEGFIQAHPLLRADPVYVEFLEKYSGFSIEEAGIPLIVDILGFSDASTDIEEMDGEVVDDEGFLLFAQCVLHVIDDGKLTGTYEHDFAFDVSGARRYGVYRKMSTLHTQDRPYEWYSDGFLTWLAELAAIQGRYELPPFA